MDKLVLNLFTSCGGAVQKGQDLEARLDGCAVEVTFDAARGMLPAELRAKDGATLYRAADGLKGEQLDQLLAKLMSKCGAATATATGAKIGLGGCTVTLSFGPGKMTFTLAGRDGVIYAGSGQVLGSFSPPPPQPTPQKGQN